MNNMTGRLLPCAFAIAAIAFASAGTAAAQDQVNARFSWKLKGEYAAFFVAQEDGLFKKANLNVRLGEGAGAQAALGALIQGQEDVVILPGVFALSAIQKGIPVKLIAIYHPKTPVALITFPDKPARTPKDLEGMTVAHSVGETGTTYLDAFLKLNGVDPSKVKRTMMNAQARVPAFIARNVDVVSVYQTNDLPIMMEKQTTKFVVMDMVKFGLSVPGLAVVSSDQNISKKADVLKRFLRATGAGVVEAKRDIADATRAMRKTWPNAPSEHAVSEQISATLGAIATPGDREIGWIDQKTIADALSLLHSVGEIEQPKAPEFYFTNALLTK
jgi:NitT/TauT family transport system substrate-binding protein